MTETLPGIAPATEEDFRKLAEWIASLGGPDGGQKDFDPSLHPRDSHGRFAETPGGADAIDPFMNYSGEYLGSPVTTEGVVNTYARGWENYRKQLKAHGGPELDYDALFIVDTMNVGVADPEDVDPEQRAICEQGAREFLDDPEMQPFFKTYGRPEIVVTSRIIGSDSLAGSDPKEYGIIAQWSNGTIFLYAPVAGDESWKQDNQNVGYSVGDGDMRATLIHEYGHQIYGVTAYDENEENSAFLDDFLSELTLGQNSTAEAEFSAGQVSTYAQTNDMECFAEMFTEMMINPDWPDYYDGGTLGAMRTIQGQLEEDGAR